MFRTHIFLSLFVLAWTASAADLVDATADAHSNDRPDATPMANTEPVTAVVGEPVAYAQLGAEAVTGYLARPKDGGNNHPGLIVIHEWWGLNDNIRQVTERLAAEGYVALAIDLYGGESAQTPKQAMSLMRGLQSDIDTANENLRQAFQYLENAQSAERVGVVGWCLGGQWSLRTALLLPEQIDAAVIYYGSLNTDPESLQTLQMPILGNFAENDPIIPLATVNEFRATLEELGKSADIKIYAGAEHAFSNPSGTAYDAEAAADAWSRTTSFFAEHLQ